MMCLLCGYPQLKKYPADLSFYLAGNKVSIHNYPYLVCPKCANLTIKRVDMKKTVFLLEKHKEKMAITLKNRYYFS